MPVATRILVVDDEAAIRFPVRDFLESSGFEVAEAATVAEGERVARTFHPELALLDFKLPDGNALDLLPRIKKLFPECSVIILTAFASIDLAVRAIKEGAVQFLTKPVELPALRIIIEREIDNQRQRRQESVRQRRDGRPPVDPFAGPSAVIHDLEIEARRALESESPILILGETGTGKGVLARWLHEQSRRKDEAFVDLNCAGLAREFLESELFGHERGAFTGAINVKQGLFEIAHRGILFLDEVGDVDPQVQPKLLKVLEEKRFRRMGDVKDRQSDVRLIGATHQNLPALVREKRFRQDLYFRISTLPLVVPPLRDRRDDIRPLAERLTSDLAASMARTPPALTEPAIRALESYGWPGNIRELKNVLERAILRAGANEITARDFAFDSTSLPAGANDETLSLTLEELERRHIEQVLGQMGGKVEEAARRLGIPRSSLYEKLRRFGISPNRV